VNYPEYPVYSIKIAASHPSLALGTYDVPFGKMFAPRAKQTRWSRSPSPPALTPALMVTVCLWIIDATELLIAPIVQMRKGAE
jgi:hypothetical protein